MSDTILILGASGFIGTAFVAECERRGITYFRASREKHFYGSPSAFETLLDQTNPTLVVNAAAFIPTPSVDLCKEHPKESFEWNCQLPGRLAAVCDDKQIPFCHLSTGCLFDERREYLENDLHTRDLAGHCGVYLSDKLAGENRVALYPEHYILRLRLPFDEVDHSRNYLSKLASFKTVFDHVNSLSHRGDFVKAALDLWAVRAPFGIYHVCCAGFISAADTVQAMRKAGIIDQWQEFIPSTTSGCKLSTKKLTDAGVKIRDVQQALAESVRDWKPHV